MGLGFTHRPLSSSFLGLPYRILNISHKKELLRGLWVGVYGSPPPQFFCESSGCFAPAKGLRSDQRRVQRWGF